MKKLLFCFFVFLAFFMVSCTEKADIVIYGKIYTAETDNPIVEAVAIKDGKYIYVGDAAGVEKYIDPKSTQLIDHRDKGMVMPSCADAHAHYAMAMAVNRFGLLINDFDDVQTVLANLRAAVDVARAEGKHNMYAFGWNYHLFAEDENPPTIEQLDAISPDIAVFLNDSEGHKGLANSLCLKNAGIIDEDGNLLRDHIEGGEICLDENGRPTGLLLEQAGTYVRSHGLDFSELFTPAVSEQVFNDVQRYLLANGYTMYMDGWSNYFGQNAYYEAARKMELEGNLHFNFGLSYEIESWCEDIPAAIDSAVAMNRYASEHVRTNWIKLFMDGTVEGLTGLTLEPYLDGHVGIANWTEDQVAEITAMANEKGLSMHIHTMGDGAIHRVVNAYERSGKKELRNTLVHVRNVVPEDFQRIADNGIYCVSGILWHYLSDSLRPMLALTLPASIADKLYPMRSLVDLGINTTAHTDFPALAGGPSTPFGIMEVAVTASYYDIFDHNKYTSPLNPEEILTREQALQVLTINGARQMFMENERGSIKVGKYADFLLIDQDVLTCEVRKLSKTKILATFFEGKKVYGE